ncbi:MAG: hypothetical protein ACXWT4_08040 [Methylobacter sp.]
MQPIQDNYPVFEANQVLTNTHLNQIFKYLDEQQRLTRANLIGIGIVCGLEIALDVSLTAIHLSKGCGITSEGYLIVEPDDVDLVAYRTYELPIDLLPHENGYEDFKDSVTKQPYSLWELFPAGEPNTSLLANPPGFLDNKAVVLFLELKKSALRNCSPNNCDDKGSAVTATVRRLLIQRDDLDSMIKAVKNFPPELTHADLELALSAQLNLPDLRLPRYDVPNSQPVTSNDVLAAFLNIFSAGNLVDATGDALMRAYEAFEPILKPAYAGNPFLGFTAQFGFLNGIPISNSQVLFLPYYYDLFDDLIRAYDEFRWKGVELLCACCPSEILFPRYLMLGLLFPESEADALIYRHHFIASAAVSNCEQRTREVVLLFQRMVEMINRFTNIPLPVLNNTATDPQIRMTPSKLGGMPLSDKAIPYYYEQTGSPPLYQLWNPEKNRRHKANQNPGYRADEYLPVAPVFITEPLAYDLEPYNFLRIEGHLGKKFSLVLQRLQFLKSRYRLPIEFIALPTGSTVDNLPEQLQNSTLNNFLISHPGIQHKAGVPLGGTFILVYHNTSNQDNEEDSIVSVVTAQENIIADFFLPYRVADANFNGQMLVRECENEWIDSIKHLNNITLRDYRFTATAKAPAANEAERNRLRNSYIIRIYRYEIQGKSILPANTVEDIVIPIETLKDKKLSAIARALNESFPLGLVFDHKAGTNKLIIRRLEGHTFHLELGGIQGNQIRYLYENDKIYRWQQETWEALYNACGGGVICHTSGGEYKEDDYKWLHENFTPKYPAPAPSPTAQDTIQWEKLTLMRARQFPFIDNLPIYNRVLQPVLNAIEDIDISARVVLIGSWANGSWVSRNPQENPTSIGNLVWEEFLKLREKVTGKSGYSDIDLLVDSLEEITPDMIHVSTGYGINIIRGKQDAQKGLVLNPDNQI